LALTTTYLPSFDIATADPYRARGVSLLIDNDRVYGADRSSRVTVVDIFVVVSFIVLLARGMGGDTIVVSFVILSISEEGNVSFAMKEVSLLPNPTSSNIVVVPLVVTSTLGSGDKVGTFDMATMGEEKLLVSLVGIIDNDSVNGSLVGLVDAGNCVGSDDIVGLIVPKDELVPFTCCGSLFPIFSEEFVNVALLLGAKDVVSILIVEVALIVGEGETVGDVGIDDIVGGKVI